MNQKNTRTFDKNGHIHVRNLSAYWVPELTVTERIGGTTYTATGSYEGGESFLHKLERISSKNILKKMEETSDKRKMLC